MKIMSAIVLLLIHFALPFVVPMNSYSRHSKMLFSLQTGLEELEASDVLIAGEAPEDGAPWSFWAGAELRDRAIELRTVIDPFQVGLMFIIWLWGLIASLMLLWSGLRTTKRQQ